MDLFVRNNNSIVAGDMDDDGNRTKSINILSVATTETNLTEIDDWESGV